MKKQAIISGKLKRGTQHMKELRKINPIRKPLFDRKKGSVNKTPEK